MIIIAALIAIALSVPWFLEKPPADAKEIRTITDALIETKNGQEDISLPHTFDKSDGSITLSFTIDASKGNVLYVKSVYSPLKVWQDNRLVLDYGEEGTYPSFLSDPPCSILMISLDQPDNGNESTIRMEYTFPRSRNSMKVNSPVFGNFSGIFRYKLSSLWWSLGISIFLIIVAIVLLIICQTVSSRYTQRNVVLFLALFFLAGGLWGFGENDLSVFIIRNPSLLYMISFIGLGMIVIPLYLFYMKIVKYNRFSGVLYFVRNMMAFVLFLGIILQLTGVMMLCKYMYVFHVLLPPALVLLFVMTLFEALRYENENAKNTLMSLGVLSLGSVMELLNYYFNWINTEPSVIFLCGIFLFFLWVSVAMSRIIKREDELREMIAKQQMSVTVLNIRLENEKKHHKDIRMQENTLRRQRHDMKHHMAVISSFLEDGEIEETKRYIGQFSEAMVTDRDSVYCLNNAANAIVSHYAAQAKELGVKTDIKMNVPEDIGKISETEISTVYGNLMENAVEACERMKGDEKFIKLRSDMMDDRLVITLDNSYDERIRRSGMGFESSKRPETGVGVVSVRTIAKMHGGEASFHFEKGVFYASIHMSIST